MVDNFLHDTLDHSYVHKLTFIYKDPHNLVEAVHI